MASDNMKQSSRAFKWGAWAVAWGLALAPAVGLADEPDPWLFSAGTKLWLNTWDSWSTHPTGTGVALGTQRYQVVQAMHSGTRLSVIPFASVRKGALFAAASFMQRTSYALRDAGTPGGFDVNADRQEADVSAGWYVVPNVALTLGYKQLTQTYGSDRFRWAGPLMGVNTSAAVAPGWALYATAGLGAMQAQFPQTQSDAQGKHSFRAGYRLGEFGIAHGMALDNPWVRSLAFTAGYRVQTVTTTGYGLAQTAPDGSSTLNTRGSLVDTTQGLALSLSAAF
ncbi:MAG: hypothetical protein RI907_1810 [Pseudomonadota bacterium]|jgi:hypothetical protein